jgi:hypothetical protein
MWVNRQKYETLQKVADDNRRDANAWRSLMNLLTKRSIIHGKECVIMSREAYDIFSNKLWLNEDKYKDIEAELEWYKIKYHEMKINEESYEM